jgi:hypothetical protein
MVTELWWKFEVPGLAPLLSACPEIEPSRGWVSDRPKILSQRFNLGVVTRTAVAMGELPT